MKGKVEKMDRSIDYSKILEAIVAFSSETNYHKLLDIVLTKMRDITNCEAGTLYMERENKLFFTIVHNEKLDIFTYEEDTNIPPVELKQEIIENVCAFSAINKKIINIDDVYESSEFNFQGPRKYDAMTGFRTQSMLVFPLSDLHDNVIGVIQLLNARDEAGNVVPFKKDWEHTIWSLSHISAIALMNVRYVDEIRELFASFVKIMTAAIDERSHYNANHTINVADNTRRFAEYLRGRFEPGSPYCLSESQEEQLVMAAYLHDIGKVITPIEVMDKATRLGDRLQFILHRVEVKRLCDKVMSLTGKMTAEVFGEQSALLDEALVFIDRADKAGFLPDEDLEKVKALKQIVYTDENGETHRVFDDTDIDCLSIRKGTLTDKERDLMQEHVSITERLLTNIKFNKQFENVPGWAASHHEFIDGTGYPHKTAGGEVPVEVRILTMMDIYDALTASDRPYRKVMPHEVALKILRSMVEEGKLDGEVVELFAESDIWVK